MIHRYAIVLVTLALGLGAATVLGQNMQKYITPDGRTVYSDHPIPGARLVGEVAPPPPVDPSAAAAAKARAKQEAEAANAAAAKRQGGSGAAQQQQSAAEALAKAKERLETGKEPLPGERTGTAGGGSRLNDQYWARQRANEQAVKDAEARLRNQQ